MEVVRRCHGNHPFSWENHRKTIGKCWFHGDLRGKAQENSDEKGFQWKITSAIHGKTHYFELAIFHSYVKLPEGISMANVGNQGDTWWFYGIYTL